MILNQVLILHVYTYITLVLRFAQFFNLLTVVYLFIFHPLHRVDAWGPCGYFSSISNRNSEEKRYLWEEYNFNWHMLRVRLYGGWATSKLMKQKIRFQGTIYSPTSKKGSDRPLFQVVVVFTFPLEKAIHLVPMCL